uniref:Uncharacterized protein n=1 Tax=Acrobeloides nanus TaxID=290746 RepID=A0A914DRL7_9BILA
MFNFFERQIAEHMSKVDYNSEPTDYVDAFLREITKRDKEDEPHYYTMPQLLNMCFDLWIAGQITATPGKMPSLERKFDAIIAPQPYTCNIQNRY